MPETPRTQAGFPASETRTPEIVARRVLHQGKRFAFEMLTVRRGGPGGGTVDREIVRHPGAVVVVPMLEDGRLVLIRNYRIAPGEFLLECCAGTLEPPGEDPAVCAGRELAEETGYKAATLTPLGWFYTTPGLTDERMHAFVATGLEHVGQDLEEDETIEVETVGVADALRMIETGAIRDGKTIVALLRAERAGLLGGKKAGG